MLKTRIILAVSCALPLLALLFYLPSWGWQALVLIALVVTAWELLRLAGIDFNSPSTAIVTLAPITALLGGALLLPVDWQWAIIHISCVLWLITLSWLTHPTWASELAGFPRILKITVTLLFILPALLVLARLQIADPVLVLVFFTLIWAADIFAYFVGKSIGGPKLAPRVSPGKTISGLIGGLLGSVLVIIGWYSTTQPVMSGYLNTPLMIILVTALIALISVGGDLLASLLKRHAGRKDSSQLLPGHGGLLDRLDSLLTAAPFFAVCAYYAGLV